MTEYFEEGMRRQIFSPQLPIAFVSRMFVYVIHGINYQLGLYKRKADIMDWCEQFCDHLENTVLKPYILETATPA